MTRNTPSGKRRRWLLFGPGTIIALIAAVGIVVAGRFTKPPVLDPKAGHIVFEADAQGHLRRVDAPSRERTVRPRLWKPEPGFLLEHAQDLKLASQQRKGIEAQNSVWLSEKAQLEQRMSQAASSANAIGPDRTVSATQIQDNLKDYSRLSREYDERRADFWRRALALLTAEQQQELSKVVGTTGRIK